MAVVDPVVAAAEAVGAEVDAVDDKFGIGFRPELAPDIISHLDELDLIEVIADDLFGATRRELDSIRLLSGSLDLVLHGVSMGLASSESTEQRRFDQMAQLIDYLCPARWSEHLAFVRAGGVEIGHLAAPPRSDAVIDGAINNLRRATRTIGKPPLVENIATRVDPPASKYDEIDWTNSILRGSDSRLLLDLHNLYANASNFAQDPYEMIARLPAERIEMIHISGGHWIEHSIENMTHTRLLDDHLHDPPEIVYRLLEFTAARASGPLTIILERDGDYPSFDSMLSQLRKARDSVADGRKKQKAIAI